MKSIENQNLENITKLVSRAQINFDKYNHLRIRKLLGSACKYNEKTKRNLIIWNTSTGGSLVQNKKFNMN